MLGSRVFNTEKVICVANTSSNASRFISLPLVGSPPPPTKQESPQSREPSVRKVSEESCGLSPGVRYRKLLL